MKRAILFIFLSIYLSFASLTVSAQAVNEQDSLALVDLYNSTNGPGWTNNTNWLTAAPVSTWYGISLANGRVNDIELNDNRLKGSIPSSFGNLSGLQLLNLSDNQLSGNLPAEIGNLQNVLFLDVRNNQLEGTLPASIVNLIKNPYPSIVIFGNRFTFAGAEEIAAAFPAFYAGFFNYSQQADIPLIKDGNILSVAAGGTLSNNTYHWYRNGVDFDTKTGDSSLTVSDDASYSVEVNNSVANSLTLYSISPADAGDSLALVALFNNTDGSHWKNNINWLTPTPLSLWYGVTVRSGRVTRLNLTSNDLSGNFPESVINLTGLSMLSLAKNNLVGNIPTGIDNLGNLKTLDLSTNKLTGKLPAEIGNLSNLNDLYLFSNQLNDTIPNSLANLSSLVAMLLNDNEFTGGIPSTFGDFSKLSELHLENNQLTGKIPGSFGKNLNLNLLYLSGNRLTGPIPDSLCNAVNIARLVVSNNDLTGKLPDSLPKLTQLFDLEISGNRIEGPLPSLSGFRNLTHLYIDRNHFNFYGLENISGIHYLNYAPQKTIQLHKNGEVLSVSAGGTVSNDTFRLYHNGALLSTQTGDSVFFVSGNGEYYITVTNSLAAQLILYSDTLSEGISLADTTTTVNGNISGTTTTEINDGDFKILKITPTAGANALSGEVTSLVTIDSTVSSFHDQPYVQRHYDITPASNAENAQATVTLYFTQKEFDDFNDYVTKNSLGLPLLPSGGIDNGNVRIIQLHGSFTTSPDPGNYNDTTTIFITPEVSWDSVNNWWEVTFPVTGFSGFFVSTANFALPVTLLQFEGNQAGQDVVLDWRTNGEGMKEFTVERSANGTTFNEIGRVQATFTAGSANYDFTDSKPLNGDNYYRLKIVDISGKFSYSTIVLVKTVEDNLSMSIYPNPVRSKATMRFYSEGTRKYSLRITDLLGKVVQIINGVSVDGINKLALDFSRYSTGTYYVVLTVGSGTNSFKVSKQ